MTGSSSIKQRAVYVYLPSVATINRWKGLATNAGVSISKFVFENVEQALEKASSSKDNQGLLEENIQLSEILNRREKRVRELELVVSKLEEDLNLVRAQNFLEDGRDRVKSYDKRLVNLLQQPGTHTDDQIQRRLGIKQHETKALAAVSRQIDKLHTFGLVKHNGRGWEWKQ